MIKGFGPINHSHQYCETKSASMKTAPQVESSGASPGSSPPAPGALPNVNIPRETNERAGSQAGRVMYCHYFSNFGKCFFEERTGNVCRFEHENAPLCQSGTSCRRSKCMYKHPSAPGRNPFLANGTNFPMNVNQWPLMMNPWLNQSQPQNQMHFPNPWGNQRNN